MQIHELPVQATTEDADQYALDTGSTTRKISFANLKNQILQKATPSFISNDSATANAWTDVAALASGEAMTTILNKVSTMFKNIRYLYNVLGTTDISGVGDGSVRGAIKQINSSLNNGGQAWTPYICDLETKLREVGSGAQYIKIGKVYFCWITSNGIDYSGINVMLQIRNVPCATVLGGSFYCGGLNDQGADYTIQAVSGAVYIRPNLKSSNFSNPAASGVTTIFFIGIE